MFRFWCVAGEMGSGEAVRDDTMTRSMGRERKGKDGTKSDGLRRWWNGRWG